MQVNVKGPQSREREWFNMSTTKDRDQPYITVFLWFNIQFINQVSNGGDGRKMPSGVNVTSKLLPEVMLRTSVTFGAEKFTNFFLLNNTLSSTALGWNLFSHSAV